jgi:hypothetical protein
MAKQRPARKVPIGKIVPVKGRSIKTTPDSKIKKSQVSGGSMPKGRGNPGAPVPRKINSSVMGQKGSPTGRRPRGF